ncbi:hypothetical protein MMON44395_27750 [Mycolicibacterium monacense DSM 44395]|nr:hypothetical protein [Mycolicibacterium monacense DSM 44395]
MESQFDRFADGTNLRSSGAIVLCPQFTAASSTRNLDDANRFSMALGGCACC